MAVIAVVAVVSVWFQPHKLLLDDEVDEDFAVSIDTGAGSTEAPAASEVEAIPADPVDGAVPVAEATEPAPITEAPIPAGPLQLAAGSFASIDLETYSTVVIWCSRFSSGFGAADLA